MFKILLAEDDRELRQLFQHVLTKNGYTAVGVSNGLEALEALEGGYFDLLISDIMMPKMDGYTLVRTIRDEGMNMPVLMITASSPGAMIIWSSPSMSMKWCCASGRFCAGRR